MEKYIKDTFNSYEEMRLFSQFRQNILCWYDFKSKSKILHLGSECGILTKFLTEFGKVICIEEREQYNNLNKAINPNIFCYQNYSEFIERNDQKFDYIVIERFLDSIENKKTMLEELLNLLDKDGEIIILANNKFGLRYFNGAADESTKSMFGNLSKSSKLYSYKQWINILQELHRKYVIYYPFPNLEFPISIYSDKTIEYNFPLFYEPSIKNKITFFDEREAFEETKRTGYFRDFCNSFFIVINPKDLYYLYSKISSERKEEFQICTNILSINNEKLVCKKALNKKGISHLQKINEYYFRISDRIKTKNFHYCPSNISGDNLLFEYIEGDNLEKIVSKYVQNQNIEGIINALTVILKFLSIEKDVKFQPSQLLKKVFGDLDYSVFLSENCQPINNTDLILENILFNDEYYVIDYEWIFNCCIPKKFIIFRAIFHSPSLSILKEKDKKHIYEYFEISKEMIEIFIEMEKNFQSYVSSQTIYNQALSSNSYSIPFIDDSNRVICVRIDQNDIFKKELNFMDTSKVDLECSLDPSLDRVCLKVEKKSIIKINSVELDGIPCENLETNANLIIKDDYYFLSPPIFKLKSNKASILKMNLTFLYYGEDAIDNIVSLIETNKSLNNQINELKKGVFLKIVEKMKR